MKIFLIAMIFTFSHAYSKEIPTMFDRLGDEVTITVFEDVIQGTYNSVQKIFNDLSVESSIDIEGVIEKKFISSDDSLSIICSEIQIESSHYFTCWIKTKLSSTNDRDTTSFPHGGYNIKTKNQLAKELNQVFSGHPVRCFKIDYADNFLLSLCPNEVSLNVTPSKF